MLCQFVLVREKWVTTIHGDVGQPQDMSILLVALPKAPFYRERTQDPAKSNTRCLPQTRRAPDASQPFLGA